jgi:O-antigen/teichoic acid export membrane protein
VLKFTLTQKKDLTWLTIGQLVSFSIGVVSTKLLTSMGESTYGLYSLILSVQGLINLMLYGPMEQGYLKFYYEYKNENRERLYIKIFVRFLLWGAGIVVAALLAINLVFKSAIGLSPLTAVLTGVFLTAVLTNVPLNSFANLKKERRYNAIMVIVERVIYIAVIFTLFTFSARTLNNALIAFIVSLVSVVVIRISGLKAGRLRLEEDERTVFRAINRRIVIFALPFVIWGIAGWFQSYSERWVLNQLLSIGAVGKYALWLMIGNIFITIPYGLMSQFIIPVIYEKTADITNADRYGEGLTLIRQFMAAIVVLTAASAVLLAVLGKRIILLLSNANFLDHWYVLIFVCIGMGMFSLGQTLSLYGLVSNKPQIYLAPKIVSGLMAVGIYYYCIRRFDIDGLIPALILINSLYLLGIVLVNKRLLHHRAAPTAG